MKTFVIAEIGPNHNGSLDRAVEMIKCLAQSGADAIKFQLAQPDAVYSADAFKADYQKTNDGAGSVIEMSRRLQLPRDAHRSLQRACAEVGITYLCTAFDLGSLEFLDRVLNVPRFKVASGELLSIDMLEYMAEQRKPVLLSTGMASIEEVRQALSILTQKGLQDITLLHCVSNYPAPHEDMNVLAMEELRRQFSYQVGLSDHSIGPEACLAAVALGARVIEKHVTLDKSLPGPDHKASATIDEFTDLVASVRRVESTLGSPTKVFSDAESGIRRMARKSIVAARDIAPGTLISKADLVFKRPGTGLSPLMRDRVIGAKAQRLLLADHVILPEDIEGFLA